MCWCNDFEVFYLNDEIVPDDLLSPIAFVFSKLSSAVKS